MLTLGQQKIDSLTLAGLALLAVIAAVLAAVYPVLMPWSFLALAGVAVMVYWAARWEITLWAWLWVLSYGLLNGGFWRLRVTGFFNMTIPRFMFIAAVVGFILHFLLKGRRLRYDRALLWVMLGLVVYCALSATATGWLADTHEVRTAPYYRFLAALLFPSIMFFLVYNSVSRERQIPWALLLLTIYGWYSLYVAYLQYAAIMGLGSARSLIWPAYINDPEYGYHFDRARGAFGAAGPQAVFMVLLFYIDLFLIRKLRGPYRAALIAQAVLTVPAVFFTGLRGGYLAFALCGVVWCLVAGAGRLGKVKLALASLAVIVATVMFWGNLTQTKRQTGGVAQVGPILARYVLLQQTWQLFADKPLTGVGFGHFVDAVFERQRDPATLVGMSTGVLVAHNLFLNMAAETGVLGLAATIAIFVLIYRQSRQLYRKLPPTAGGWLCRDFVALFWVALVNYLTASMFRDTLWDVFANALFWSLAGLVVGYNRLLEPHPLDLPVSLPTGRPAPAPTG